MSTQNSWPVSSVSAIGSPATAVKAAHRATRLAYVEMLAYEQKGTTVGFLARAVGWFSEQGITCRRVPSDNGASDRSSDWRKGCRALDMKRIRTKPYTPQTNGKAKRFIKLSWQNGPTSSPISHRLNATSGYHAI